MTGKLIKQCVRLLVGDRVTCEMTPYDLTKCRITYRHKDGRGGLALASILLLQTTLTP
jgi:translation initiation factor IF-1